MTREEEIMEAGIEYTMRNNPSCIGGDNFYEQARRFNRNRSFEAGAEWADTNPKSTWIRVEDDLPCNHEDLLENEGITKPVLVVVESTDNPTYKRIEVSYMCNKIGSINVGGYYWKKHPYSTITHWKRLPEFPEE